MPGGSAPISDGVTLSVIALYGYGLSLLRRAASAGSVVLNGASCQARSRCHSSVTITIEPDELIPGRRASRARRRCRFNR